MTKSDSRLATLLVAWYGVYQAAHILFNSLYFAGVITSFPPGPPGGWTQQALDFFTGMAAIGLINALLSLLFVVGYFQRRAWSLWLGAVTLTVALWAMALFSYGTLAGGAWPGNLIGYLWIYLPFIPVVVPFAMVSVWAMQKTNRV